jgi:serine/threonine protein kinase
MRDSNTYVADVLESSIDTGVSVANSKKPFDHDRYEILATIDRGCWGIAYDVRDLVTDSLMVAKDFDPNQIAIRQLKERNLTLNDVIRNEYTEMRTPDGVVPTWIEKDKNGKLFLIMPKYERDFESVITRGDHNRHLNDGLSLDDIVKWGNNISTSICGYHKEYDEAHCDIKPDNLFVDKKGKLWLGDSGTSTGTSHISFDTVRSNMGFINTRAPENFRNNARPNERSDVWSFGSLMYRMFTGKYVLEDELDNAVDPAKYIEGLDDKMAKVLINNRLKNVPKPFRKFMKKCLTFEYYGKNGRYENGMEMKKAWDETVDNLDPWHFYKSQVKKYVFPAIGVGMALTGIIYGSKLEPTKVDMPKSNLVGQVYTTEVIPKTHLVFERDTIPEPKELIDFGAMNISSSTLRMYTQNMYVAHFLRAFNGAILERGEVNIDAYTEEQFKTYIAYTTPDERGMGIAHGPLAIMAKSLEVAIKKSQTPRGTIDLEDVFAISRMGEDKINMARRISGSFDYKIYSKAKDASGQYIIPEKEQSFIMSCLSRVDLEK